MKILIITLLFVFLSFNSFSQHNYENPRSKAKRGLLEDAQEQAPLEDNVKNKTEKTVDNASKMSKGERMFCACEKTYFLSLKRLKLWNKLREEDIINNDTSVWTRHDRHQSKSKKAMKMIRSKYDVDLEFDCEHTGLTHKKLSTYKKEISKLVDSCDIDIITE